MTISRDRKRIQLPTSGAVFQGTKGEPHHSMFALEAARNLGYTMNHRVPQMLISGCGWPVDDGGITPPARAGQMFDTYAAPADPDDRVLGPHGRAPVWWPHVNDLTLQYAIRACQMSGGSDGKIDIIVADKPWPVAGVTDTAPGNGLYVKTTITVSNATYNTGTGAANGEYTGSIQVTWPRAYDGMVYIYIIGRIALLGTWAIWVAAS